MSHNPVMSLTVIDARTLENEKIIPSTKIFVGARCPKTNITHPGVVSVPTMRIPRSLLEDIKSNGPNSDLAYFRNNWVDNRENGHEPTIMAVEALLARKLEMAVGLEYGMVPFRARLVLTKRGVAVYENGAEESIEMANFQVVLLAPDYVDRSLASYSKWGWVTAKDFLEAVETKDPRKFNCGFDDLEVFSVKGLCTESTALGLLCQPL